MLRFDFVLRHIIRLWFPLVGVFSLSLVYAADRSPAAAEEAFKVYAGLEVTTFAAEPDVVSISNLDVDHRGRVWACEAVNYRFNNGKRPSGDRILILEDTDGDGRSDHTTVFYQGRDIDIPMGICVLGSAAIVSVAPDILLLTDTDGDDRADKKEVLYTGDADPQNDHSLHSLMFGPDGRYYGNFGNAGKRIAYPSGQTVVDLLGNAVQDGGKPYWGGMVYRCDPGGTQFEVLGHNFRNNYEAVVDSFGNVWQSDNDDDGNRAARINYILEGGNYGYRDEQTGAGWREPRINTHQEIPHRHWHQNDPGSVPNLLHTGAGAPAGITIYEGELLPDRFHGALLHADSGRNVVRAYPVRPSGAGYTANSIDVITTDDLCFRPIDVAVAPDGAIYVSDWYDPIVGGYRQDDIDRGRIYRLAPPGYRSVAPVVDVASPKSAVDALQSPNLCARRMAWLALRDAGAAAEADLFKLFRSGRPPHRARALWLLGLIEGRGPHYIRLAIVDDEPRIRIVGLRLAQLLNQDVIETVSELVADPSPRVRAECAVALRYYTSSPAAELWAQLAKQYDGLDRWYLEALGIGAGANWDPCFHAWLSDIGDNWNTPAGRDIVWRSRAAQTVDYLATLIADPSTPARELPRLIRALDFQRGPVKQIALKSLLTRGDASPPDHLTPQLLVEIVTRTDQLDLNAESDLRDRVVAALTELPLNNTSFQLIAKHDLQELYPSLVEELEKAEDIQRSAAAAGLLLDKSQGELLRDLLDGADRTAASATITAIAAAHRAQSPDLLMEVIDGNEHNLELRRLAVRSIQHYGRIASELLRREEEGKLEPALREPLALVMSTSGDDELRTRADELFPPLPSRNNKPMPRLSLLAERRGDAGRGQNVFRNQGKCSTCHRVSIDGKQVGPDLTQIGDKLDRRALYESILFPSAGINYNYETYSLLLESGLTVRGIITSQTNDEVVLTSDEAIVQHFPKSEIEHIQQQSTSLMPADLQKLLTAEELVDLVEYLTTLRSSDRDR